MERISGNAFSIYFIILQLSWLSTFFFYLMEKVLHKDKLKKSKRNEISLWMEVPTFTEILQVVL